MPEPGKYELIKYFVSYFYGGTGRFGQVVVTMDHDMATRQDIEDLTRVVEMSIGLYTPVTIVSFQRLPI